MRRSLQSFAVCLLVVFACAQAVYSRAGDANETLLELRLPLENGRLNIRDVLVKLGEALGINSNQAFANLNWSVDVSSTLGRVQLHVFDRLAAGVITTDVQNQEVIVRLNREALKTRLAHTGHTIESWLNDLGGGAKEQQSRAYGLTFITAANERTPIAELSNPPKRAVVLVHGLDDPGFMWGDLIPLLQKAGYSIARFDYPNDGPIADSADLLAAALADAHAAGIQHVDVVAHSMGGLVTRDVLTRPAYYHGDGSGGDRFPSVDRLIMLGTPNHGSELARLRGVTEIGEHLYRIMTGKDGVASKVGDGSGEAGIDLLPGSEFLRRLNDRPLATHVSYTIIAGRWSPVGSDTVSSLMDKTERLAESESAPQWLRDWASEKNRKLASSLLTSAIDGLGDGCVTIDSARLPGVDDFVIVKASHIDMLLTIGSDKMPAAIPIVLDRLKSDAGH